MGREFVHDDLEYSSLKLMAVLQDMSVWRTPSRISPSPLAGRLYSCRCVSGEGYVLCPTRHARAHASIRNKDGCGQRNMVRVGG